MRKLILAAASVAALALAGPASAQSPIVIKFSHVVASNTPKGAAAEKFKELAEKYTDGKVKVEIYPNSTLYKDKEELEALQLGAVQMLAPSNSKFGPIGVREFEVFDLPYILPDLATLRKVTDGPLGAKLLKLLQPKGMIGLAYWDNGFKQMTANKKLIAPDDYKGLKFRIQSSKVLEAQFRALGADSAGDGILGSVSGAADRRGRRPGEHRVQYLHPENARSAEIPDHDQPWLHRLCRGREQEVLGRSSRRYSQPARKGHEGSHRLRQRAIGQGKRGSACGHQEGRQDRNRHLDAGAGRRHAQGDGAGLQGCCRPGRSALDRRIHQGNRRQ